MKEITYRVEPGNMDLVENHNKNRANKLRVNS
jgi:hypothetical protein